MSWDLHPEEMIDKASSLPVTQTPEVGVFHNFMEGAAKAAMQGFAKTARAVDLLGAVGPIVEDWATDVQNRRALGSVPATMPKTVTAQDRYFKEHDALFQSAVDYWTPRPNEVGVAGEVAGSLLNMLPTIMASPALAVGATQLAQGQDLVQQGVDPGKAQAVGAVQALGLGAGIWMPILGTNALQRIVIGGAGFNVVQGVATRAASKAILEGDKAAEQFRPLGGTELTLDILLGLAFGGMAHINPAQRAQGAKAWEDIGNFLKDAPPSDKAALATLREAQHINLDSLPGTPQTAADLDVHVQRMRAAIESLATDKPVDVENIVKEPLPIRPGDPRSVFAAAETPRPSEMGAGQEATARDEKYDVDIKLSKDEKGYTITETDASGTRSGEITHGMGGIYFKDLILNMEGEFIPAKEVRQAGTGEPDPAATPFKPDASNRQAVLDLVAEMEFERARGNSARVDELAAILADVASGKVSAGDALARSAPAAPAAPDANPRYNPDMARIEQDQAIREAIQEHAKTVAAEEGIPQIPDRKTIAQTIEEQLVQAGRPAEEAKAGATLWQAFFDTTASRYGRTGQELFDRYMKGITGQAGEGPMLAQARSPEEWARLDAAYADAVKSGNRRQRQQLVNEAAGIKPMTARLERGDGIHSPSDAESGAPGWDLTGNGIYPEDVYGMNGRRYYGTGDDKMDNAAHSIVMGLEGKPNAPVKVYRAVETDHAGKILPGDWITTVRAYAQEHGRSNMGGNFKIISKTVTAKDIYTSGDSWLEWGYNPQPKSYPRSMAAVADGAEQPPLSKRFGGEQLFQGAVPWYHSELERQIGTAKMGAASPKDWKNFIKGLSNKGVKADEVKWTGLEEWLDLQQGKVTKEQIQQYMKDGGVKVEETTLGEGSQEMAALRKEIGTLREDIIDKQHQFQDSGYLYREVTTEIFNELPPEWQAKYQELNDIRDRYNKLADQERDDSSPTKFATYQLPGGENYRELLLTLPETGRPATLPEGYSLQEMARGDYTLVGPDGSGSILPGTLGASESYRTNAAIEMLRRKGVLPPEPTPFRSSHFDQPNILAHIRFNERTDADGKKVLFIEEIQSDWAQKGKKEGFAGEKVKAYEVSINGKPVTAYETRQEADDHAQRAAKYNDPASITIAETMVARNDVQTQKPPQAPFVGKTEAWVGLSLKRMIRYASENGFDKIAWANGEQQAARYDLSKQIKEIEYIKRGDLYELGITQNNGDGLSLPKKEFTAAELEDVVGKEVAKKIVEGEGRMYRGHEGRTLEGLDLKVGGEGMKAFYDRIVPNVANDVLKKLGGGRVGEVKIDMIARAKNGGMEMGDHLDRQENPDFKVQPQPGFDITPSMREKAMETQALFQPERGALQFDQQGKMAIALLKSADPSTFLHESGHFFLEVTNDLASQPDAPAAMKQDMQTLYSWFGLKDADTWNNMTLDEKRPYHEQFARGFERYLRDGQAPTPVLKGLFQRFRDWLKAVYQSASQLNVEVSDQVRAVMDRMLAEPQRTEAPPEATRSATPPPPRGGVGEPMGEASVLTEVQQVREDIMAAEHTARQRWGDAIVDALYEKYAPHLEDAGQLRGMSAIMESLAEDAKPAYLMKTMGPRPKEPQSLIAAIKELGGINTSMRSDIAGPDKKGVPVSLFRKAGKNVDELALLLQEKGFLNEADIANESDNGGINKLMEMIQDEIGGNKHYSERDATQAAALREHDQFMESIDGKGESASTHFTPEEWATIQREVIAEGLAPTAKNVVDADAVSIAMQIDEARVERAAITAADDHDFMAEVREIIDGYKPQPDATAAERSTPTAAKPGTPGPAGQEANATGADRNAGNQGVIAQQALRMVAENPDLPIATGVDAQGNTTYQKASEYLAEAKAMADLKRQDVGLFELAAQCLLGGGR